MYVIIISTVIYIQHNIFFRGIRYFNPSQKYFSTALIPGISSVIHQILLKKQRNQ